MDDTTNTETRHVNQEKAEDFYSAYSYEEHGPPTTQSQGETLHPASYGILNPDLQSYIKNCEPMLDDSQFESSEDLDAFLDSVYQEIRGKEVIVMTDHDCSRILEKLLRVSNDYQIMHVFSCIIGKVPELVIHRFSSHVVQTLLTLTAPGVDRELKGDYMGTAAADSDNEQEDGPGTGGPTHTYEELVQALTKELEPHWAVMISDTYASHVIQTLLLLLSNDMATAATSSGAESLGSIRSKKSAKYASDNNSLVPQ
ncbi:Nucleolar protein 9, partial [Spiromyces aspiralis]